jgi:hypothetical protein
MEYLGDKSRDGEINVASPFARMVINVLAPWSSIVQNSNNNNNNNNNNNKNLKVHENYLIASKFWAPIFDSVSATQDPSNAHK